MNHSSIIKNGMGDSLIKICSYILSLHNKQSSNFRFQIFWGWISIWNWSRFFSNFIENWKLVIKTNLGVNGTYNWFIFYYICSNKKLLRLQNKKRPQKFLTLFTKLCSIFELTYEKSILNEYESSHLLY